MAFWYGRAKTHAILLETISTKITPFSRTVYNGHATYNPHTLFVWLLSIPRQESIQLLRGGIVIRTHDVPKKPYIPLLLHTILGPDYYDKVRE